MAEIKEKASKAEFVMWFGPVLDALRQLGGFGKPKEVVELIAKNENVPENKQKATLKSGFLRFPNQVAFARQYLVWEGLIENNVHGLWELSPDGYKTYLDETEARKIFLKWVDYHQKNREEKNKKNKNIVQNDDEMSSNEGYDSGVEDDEVEEIQPFDPEEISLDTKVISMDACLRRLEQGTIKLDPDFQRKEVWTDEKKSQLIESLMLKIPIPMFYVSADEKGIWSVVDGLQRLSTIRDFILGESYLKTKEPKNKGEGFRLNGLEFWGDKYSKHNFKQLPVNIHNRILETNFTFTIINPGTPEDVKRNVFKRINTGGLPLTRMEIRHALYTGESTKLLHLLSEREDFLYATDNSVKSTRMMDRELILRFLSFTIRHYSSYSTIKNDMDAFLSDTMRIINLMPNLDGKEAAKLFKDENAKNQVVITDISQLNELFIVAMKRAKIIFGVHTFRKSYANKRRSQINKALFEVWSVLLSKLTNEDFETLDRNKNQFLENYYLLLEDINFTYAISRDSWKYTGVVSRHERLTDLINRHIRD